MGQVIKQSRAHRFIEAVGPLAEKHMGIKSDSLISQSLGYHEETEKVFFFVQINTDDTAVELMHTCVVFDPENMDDEDIIECAMSALQLDDDAELRDTLKKAEVVADGQ